MLLKPNPLNDSSLFLLYDLKEKVRDDFLEMLSSPLGLLSVKLLINQYSTFGLRITSYENLATESVFSSLEYKVDYECDFSSRE